MVVVGHQPQYMPYLGIFNKIAKSDIFIFADNLQYNKKAWQNQTLIKSIDGREINLKIPVSRKGRLLQKINEVEIIDNYWIAKHLKSIRLNYSKTVGYDEVYPVLDNLINKNNKFLVDYTIPLMLAIMDMLHINTNIKIGSEINISGAKTDLLVDILRKVGGDTYLSGEGAKNYFDKSIFEKMLCKHKYNYFKHPKYFQGNKRFLGNMSAIDLLFYNGKEEGAKIFWDNINENKLFNEE